MMEHIRITIVTEDKEYGKALGTALLNVCRTLVIRILDPGCSHEGLSGEKGSCGECDVLLWDSSCAKAPARAEGCSIRLVEQPSLICKDFENGRFALYRYSGARRMIAEIFEIYEAMTGRRPVNLGGASTSIYAFASWAGGTGCSTLAASVGQELCRFYDKKTLYLSMEEIESTENFIESYSGAKPLGRYLYRLFKDRNAAPFLDGYLIRDEFGMEAFAPTRGRNPLRDMRSGDFLVFMETLLQSGRYDVIILDLGVQLSPNDLACMEMAERICMVATPGGSSYRQAQYLQHIICRCGEELTERILTVTNMAGEYEAEEGTVHDDGAEQELLAEDMRVPRSRYFMRNDTGRCVLPEDEFGRGIAALTERLVNPAGEALAACV